MSHNHITADSDVRFVLDPITRKLSTDSGRKTLAQGDHRSEIFTFDLPRYIEGHDMSLCTSAQIHFTNTEGKQPKRTSQDLWEATDFELSGDAVTFTWKIENTATKYVGSLAFSIKLQCISVDEAAGYVIDYEYNSLEYTKISVAAAQNNIEETVEESTSLLSSFKEQALSEVEDRIAEAEKEAAESLADKMQDYVDAAEEAAKRAETIVDLTIDAELNKNSENPIQNKAVAKALSQQEKRLLPTITSTDNGKSPIVRNGEWGLSFIDEDFHKIEISENNKGWGSDMSNLVFNKDGSFTSNDKAARLYLPEYVSMGKTVTVNIKGSSDSDFRVWLASGGYRASNLWESAEDANFSIGQPFDITIELTAEDADNKGAEQATMICFMGANYNAYLQNLNITSMSIKYSGNTSGSIKQSDKGVANGVATLDESGKVPSEQLPSMDYVPISEKSQAGGVASLDADGKVPSDQLPAMDYIPTNQKGVANGVATLGSGGKIPTSQIPSLSYISTSQKGAAGGVATLDSEGKVPIGSIPVDEITGTLELIATMSLTPKTYTYEVTQDNLGQAFSLSDVLISFDEITMDNGPKFSFKHGSDYADAKEIHYSGNAAIKPTSTRKYSGWIDYKHTDIGWIPSCRIASDPISSGAKYFCGLWSPTINTDTNLVNGVKLEMETTTTSSSTGTIYIYGVRA